NDLSFISTISPRLVDVNGELDIDMSVIGKISSPDISGRFLIADASFILPEAGIEVSEIAINGNTTAAGGYELNGRASSGGGDLQFTANIQELPGMITAGITGNKVEIMNLPEIRSLASPDIQLEFLPDTTRIKGMVEITDTLIDLDEIRGSATLSDDVVFTEQATNLPPRSQTRTDARLTIRLGDNNRIQGQGITGALTGNLEIFSTRQGQMLGNGEISIIDGRFSAYGQSLQIRQGSLIYSNNQLDNPELRITAVRVVNGGNITAGIQVSGFLSNPVIELFSNQGLSDDEILAYIVFGRPISSLTSGEGADLVGAATSIGLRNSGFLTKRLSSTFQLDDVQINAEAGTEDASLLVGKYLTPKLYISYVMGLFDNFSTAKIRYDINNTWSLEARSGEDVSVDIYYQIDK
ncbi:MAG: translocation/assembly module TamB domain-containing protein, partial [Gammaproteobacteria bacterium]